jgi:hypothetical protein
MAFDCEHCGFRNNEIKGGGAIPLKVRRHHTPRGGHECALPGSHVTNQSSGHPRDAPSGETRGLCP